VDKQMNTQDNKILATVLASVALVFNLSFLLLANAAPSFTKSPKFTEHLDDDATITLLPDGNVLVAGGWKHTHHTNDFPSNAELYNPTTKKWSVTGAMATVRWCHTATFLTNGLVLVVGGVTGSGDNTEDIILSSAELYDPAAKKWTNTGALNHARGVHTAILLTNGMVLVVGGENRIALSSAELYDPATGTWTVTDDMKTPRENNTITLLPNGLVLVTGGRNFNAGLILSSAELYDPATRKWTATDNMNAERSDHTATLLTNGQVLVTGGGVSEELYDPATGKWTLKTGTKTKSATPVSVPPTISITSPKNNAVFNTTWVNVCGTFTGTAVRQISFDEIPAFINGNTFEMTVSLKTGTNTITVVLQDWDLSNILLSNADTADTKKAAMLAQAFDGKTAETSINIIGITNANGEDRVVPVQFQFTPIGGLAPLQVAFQVQAHVPGEIQHVFYDFNGDNFPDQTNSDLRPVTHTYTTSGEYFPLVTVQTTAGRFSGLAGEMMFSGMPLFVNVQMPPVLMSAIKIADPVDVKWTATSNLYVLSGKTATITEFDANQKIIRSLKEIGSNPSSLDVDDKGNVYVVMTTSNQVFKFKPTTNSFEADIGFSNGVVNGNNDGSADSRGHYVADTKNNRVQIFYPDSSDELLRLSLSGELGLNHPKAVAAVEDPVAEKLYIADTGNNRVILVKLPLDNPEAVWTNMKAHLISGDIPGAIFYFSDEIKTLYRSAFLAMDKSEKRSWAESFGTIKPVSIKNGEAVYACKNRDGTPDTIKFVKEKGVWKIKMNAD
jgi:hypothetical protein